MVLIVADRKIIDDTHSSNHALHSGDNGRVVRYDNQHGYHHRHYFGTVETVDTKVLPGHGQMKEVRACAASFRLEAWVM